MKAIITGGAGFIGSALATYLVGKGNEVLLLDNLSHGKSKDDYLDYSIKGLHPRKVDIRHTYPANGVEKCDVLFHLASVSNLALCQTHPDYAYDVNVVGTIKVLEAARLSGVRRIVFASTSAVYENTDRVPNFESDPIQPDLIYSLSKKAAEEVCMGYVRNYGMDIRILRFFNVYGPGQDHTRDNPPLIPSLIHSYLSQSSPIIYGSGDQERDYIHIHDVIKGIEKVGRDDTKLIGQTINLGSGEVASPKKIWKIIEDWWGPAKEPPIFVSADGMWNNKLSLFTSEYPFSLKRVAKEAMKYNRADLHKAKNLLSWGPRIKLKDGIIQTLEAIREKYYNV